MYYVRISELHPRDDERERVEQIIDETLRFTSELPGYVSGYRLIPQDGSGEVWRVVYWESEEAANHAAQEQHILALRSQLVRLLSEERHEERSFLTP